MSGTGRCSTQQAIKQATPAFIWRVQMGMVDLNVLKFRLKKGCKTIYNLNVFMSLILLSMSLSCMLCFTLT